MKSYRWTAIALGVLALLLAYTRWLERSGDAQRAHILKLDKNKITKVEIAGGGARLILTKDSTGWSIQEPTHFEASGAEMISFFGNFSDLQAESEVAIRATELKRYGLETPQKRIVFFEGDRQVVALNVGAAVQIGSGFYVQKEGDPKLYVVASYRLERYQPDPLIFRERQVVKFDKGAVEKVSFRNGIEAFEVAKTEAVDWTKVENFLQDLGGLQVSEFVTDQATDEKTYGLDHPALEITLEIKDSAPLAVQMGSEKQGSGFYFRIVGKPSVYLIPSFYKDKLFKKAENFTPPPPPSDPYAPADPYGNGHAS